MLPIATFGTRPNQTSPPEYRRQVTLPKGPSFTFYAHGDRSDLVVSEQINSTGSWEPLETEVLCRLLPLYSIFIDLGANIGWYTVIAQRVMRRNSRIYSFEPDPNNFRLLKKNSRRLWPWPRTTLVQAAISDRIGNSRLHLSTTNKGDHRIYASETGRETISIQLTTLDAYFGDTLKLPFILKSDTQGSEPRILRGGKGALSQNIAASVIFIEFWPHGIVASGESIETFVSDLSALPHQVFVLDNSAMRIRQITWERVAALSQSEIAPSTEGFVDLLLLPERIAPNRALDDLIQR